MEETAEEYRTKIAELNEQINASHQELSAYSSHNAKLEQQLAEAVERHKRLIDAAKAVSRSLRCCDFECPWACSQCPLIELDAALREAE